MHDFMLETFIRTTPEKVWEALTSTEISKRYMIMGAGIHSTFKADDPYEFRASAS